MKSTSKLGSTALAAVLAATTSLQAQNTSTSRDDQSSITVTGCLQAGGADRAAVGTSGSSTAAGGTTAGTTAAGSTTAGSQPLMLVNARVGSAPGGGSGVTTVAPAGSGTNESAVRAGSTPPSPAISGGVDKDGNSAPGGGTYVLRGDNPELPRHVGEEVEISGRLIAADAATGTAGAASATGTAGAAAGSGASAGSARMQQLEVRTIRMIASVCAAR